MTKKELEEIRDRRAFVYDLYKKGFNTCMEILLPIIKDYEEALEFYAQGWGAEAHDASIVNSSTDCGDVFYGVKAREVLKKHRGNE